MADSGKVVTTDNLAVFKSKMESVIDQKVENAGGAALDYATEQDILDLFTEPEKEN